MAQWASMLGVWSRRVEAILAASTRALRETSTGTVAIAALAAVGLVWGLYQAARAVPRDENTQRRLRVLITGGTRGLGAAMARKFAALGDDVAVAARRRAPLSIPTVFSNQKIVALQCDITRPSEVEELGLQVVRDLGSVDLWCVPAFRSRFAQPPSHVGVCPAPMQDKQRWGLPKCEGATVAHPSEGHQRRLEHERREHRVRISHGAASAAKQRAWRSPREH